MKVRIQTLFFFFFLFCLACHQPLSKEIEFTTFEAARDASISKEGIALDSIFASCGRNETREAWMGFIQDYKQCKQDSDCKIIGYWEEVDKEGLCKSCSPAYIGSAIAKKHEKVVLEKLREYFWVCKGKLSCLQDSPKHIGAQCTKGKCVPIPSDTTCF